MPALAQDGGPLGPYDPSLTIVTRGALFDSTHFGNDGWGSLGVKGTVPIGNFFGVMGEAAVGTNSYWGGAGHFYWRDPTKGLLGVFGSYETDSQRQPVAIWRRGPPLLQRLFAEGRGRLSGLVQPKAMDLSASST